MLILGGGPNRIGQGIEFDYCCCHASFSLRDAGYETIMMNSNPETVSTDYDTSSRLYFEPLTVSAQGAAGWMVHGVHVQCQRLVEQGWSMGSSAVALGVALPITAPCHTIPDPPPRPPYKSPRWRTC